LGLLAILAKSSDLIHDRQGHGSLIIHAHNDSGRGFPGPETNASPVRKTILIPEIPHEANNPEIFSLNLILFQPVGSGPMPLLPGI
jgi:hypothetical protein